MRIAVGVALLTLLALPVLAGRYCIHPQGECPSCNSAAMSAITTAGFVDAKPTIPAPAEVPASGSGCCGVKVAMPVEQTEPKASSGCCPAGEADSAATPAQAAAEFEAASVSGCGHSLAQMQRGGCHCVMGSDQTLPMPQRNVQAPEPQWQMVPFAPIVACADFRALNAPQIQTASGLHPPGVHFSISTTILRI